MTAIRYTDRVPARPNGLGPSDIVMDRRPDGTIYAHSPFSLPEYPVCLSKRLEHWAEVAPDRVFLAERDGIGDWRKITYRETLQSVCALGEALLRYDLSPERPLVILSGNSVEHGLLGLAAMHVGIPYAPISPAYSLLSTDFAKLRHIVGRLTPGLVYVEDGGRFARALAATVPPDIEIVLKTGSSTTHRTVDIAGLMRTQATPAVQDAAARVGPDTIGKILFTSGSTGLPKGVINSQRMMCSNQSMGGEVYTWLKQDPPVLLDWSPWNHTAGGNVCFNMTLYYGGTLHLDDGRPVPGEIERTVRNLREVAPTQYFNVPLGFDALIPYFRADRQLRETFFSRLRMLWYAGAVLSDHTARALDELAIETCGHPIVMTTGLGSTESGPQALLSSNKANGVGRLGVPIPGVDLKLVPNDGKLEVRFRSPSITPGYWRDPALTAAAFDEEGFYLMCDAVRFADPEDPTEGFLFDGRVSEDFKLTTGTWVSVGPLRAALLGHCAPLAQDIVVAGHDRLDIRILIFPDLDACRRLIDDGRSAATLAEIAAHPTVRSQFALFLGNKNRESTGSSNRVRAAILLDEAPAIDTGEMTDKGSINQRNVLKNRAALVAELYADPPSPRTIVPA